MDMLSGAKRREALSLCFELVLRTLDMVHLLAEKLSRLLLLPFVTRSLMLRRYLEMQCKMVLTRQIVCLLAKICDAHSHVHASLCAGDPKLVEALLGKSKSKDMSWAQMMHKREVLCAFLAAKRVDADLRSDHKVLGLHVAVHKAGVVQPLQREQHVLGHHQHRLQRQRPFAERVQPAERGPHHLNHQRAEAHVAVHGADKVHRRGRGRAGPPPVGSSPRDQQIATLRELGSASTD